MRHFFGILASLALFLGVQHMALAQPADAATLTAVSKFTQNPKHCSHFLGASGAGVDGLDAAYSHDLGAVLSQSGSIQKGLDLIRTGCTDTPASIAFGGVVGFYLHPAHCQTLTGAGPINPALMQKLSAEDYYQTLYKAALASATDSIGGESLQALSDLKQLCSVRAAGLPYDPSAF